MRTTAVIDRAADVAEVVVRRLGDAGGGRGRAVARRLARGTGRTVAYTRGRLQGVRYAAAGRHPDENVTDDVLADRVRTELGPVLHRLDLPKVHVTVEHHVVLLHGEVDSLRDVKVIGRAVAAVPGVTGVRSALHVGLLPGTTRPSRGRGTEVSPTLRRLLDAADRGGAEPHRLRTAVGVVVGELLARMRPDEARRLRGHLPADVRATARTRFRPGSRRDVVDGVAWSLGVSDVVAAEVLRSVGTELAELDPAVAPALRRILPADLVTAIPE